jgi:hypothetical protein
MAKPIPAQPKPPARLPQHANAEVHARIMTRLREMTPEEFKASLARSGICTPDGRLTEFYSGTSTGSSKA